MSRPSGTVCDGCDSVCNTIEGDWNRTVCYIGVNKYDRISGGKKTKYHLCHDECVSETFQRDVQDREVDVRWAYNTDEERITGARWKRYDPHIPSPNTGSGSRDEFPDDIEEMATTIEEIIFND